jgi:hypothetical protein
MTGILWYKDDEWYVRYKEVYNDLAHEVAIPVRPNRINELNSVGTFLKHEDLISFQIQEIETFPYRYAVPVVETKLDAKESIPAIPKKYVKKFKIDLMLSGFAKNYATVTCTSYDNNSNGYWYFYDQDEKSGQRTYLAAYPISKTALTSIKQVEVEVD